MFMKLDIAAVVLALSAALTWSGLAADPPGSTPSGAPAGESTGQALPPLPVAVPRPVLYGISVPLPPPSIVADTRADDDAAVDAAIGVLILMHAGAGLNDGADDN